MIQTIKEVLKISGIPIVIASLCCLSPVILVSLSVASISFASSLADTLYRDYKWYFRAVGLIALLVSFYFYSRKTLGICSIDDAVKKRNELINKLALAVIVGVFGYIFFLYGVVHYIGVFLNLWN